MNQKNCLVIHGCPESAESRMDLSERTYTKHWIPWIRRELNARGISTQVPLLPEPWAPVYEKFKAEFEKYPVGESTILIGHSCGGAFLVRWLGDTKQKIDTLILVAPWKIPDPNKVGRDVYYEYPIDETIKDRVDRIVEFIPLPVAYGYNVSIHASAPSHHFHSHRPSRRSDWFVFYGGERRGLVC